ncbi:MAG: Rieske 2Fe-2S domain-containing protein [Nitrospirales bacterium]
MAEYGEETANKVKVATWSGLEDRMPAYGLVGNVDLVVVRYDEAVSVFYGRCLHRGALMADGSVEGQNLICGLHGWDYRLDSGISEYNNQEVLHKFTAWIDQQADAVYVDESEIETWEQSTSQPFKRDEYLGTYADTHPVQEEPHVGLIQNYLISM